MDGRVARHVHSVTGRSRFPARQADRIRTLWTVDDALANAAPSGTDLEKAGHFHPDRHLDRHWRRGVASLAQERGARPAGPSRRATARLVPPFCPDGALDLPPPLL